MNVRRMIAAIAGWTALVSMPLRAQGSFEGMIESTNLTTDEMGNPQKYIMRMYVTERMVRVEIPSYGTTPGTAMIYRRDRKSVVVLNDAEKSYFEMPQEADVGRESFGGRPEIKRTGRTKKILGYPSEQLVMRSGDAETEFWGTKKLAALARSIAGVIESGGEGGSGVMNDELAALGYFPLLAQTRLEGVVVESSEVTRLERRKCDPAIFEIPAGYRKEALR